MPYRVLDDNNSDGVVLGQPGAKIGFYGQPAVPQRSNPMQATVQAFGAAQLLTFVVMPTPIGGCVSMNTQEAVFSITPTFAASAVGNFCASPDFVLAVNKQQSIASTASVIGIGGVRMAISGNAIQLNLVHGTNIAGAATAQGDPLAVVIAQGLPVISVTLTGVGVVSASTSEQIFTITGINAAGTAVINTAGQVVGVQITNHGQGYMYPPAVVLSGGVPLGGVITPNTAGLIGGSPLNPSSFAVAGAGNVVGTFSALDAPAATAAYPYGSGASACAITDTTGRVIAVVITNQGSGYQIAPSVTFVGGNTFAPGMIAHVNKSTPVSGIAIGGVRVAGPYQIAIQFMNVSTATISPIPADTYRFVVNNDFAAVSNLLQYRFQICSPVLAGILGVASSTSVEFAATAVGALATDMGLPGSTGTYAVTNIMWGQTRVIANGMSLQLLGAGCNTPLNTDWVSIPILKQQPVPPTTLLYPYLSPTSAITAQSFGELTFTVTGVPANSIIHVNKPSATNGIAVVNARVSAANTVYIGYQNVLTSAVTLPSEFYTIEVFNQPIGAVCIGSDMRFANNALCHIQQINPTLNAAIDLLNEIRDAKVNIGTYKGF